MSAGVAQAIQEFNAEQAARPLKTFLLVLAGNRCEEMKAATWEIAGNGALIFRGHFLHHQAGSGAAIRALAPGTWLEVRNP